MSEVGKFIVVFKEGTTPEQIDEYAKEVGENGGEVTHRYGAALKGFAAKLTEQTLTSFQGSDIIEYVEADGEVTTQ